MFFEMYLVGVILNTLFISNKGLDINKIKEDLEIKEDDYLLEIVIYVGFSLVALTSWVSVPFYILEGGE